MSELREMVGGPLDGKMCEVVICDQCDQGEVMSYIEHMMAPDGRHVQHHLYDFDYEAQCWRWQSYQEEELAITMLLYPKKPEPPAQS